MPRNYSLASGVQNGFVEICVRNVPGGLCSGQLHSLKPGDHISAAFQANPGFRLNTSKTPVILIGAGAGIAPLVGIIRNNKRKRPMRLYFGLRHPQSDFLYRQELGDWHKSGFLHSLKAAFSRAQQRLYVQDRLRQDAGEVAALVRDGAQIMGTRYSAIIMREDTRCPEGLERALFEAVDRQMSTWKPESDLMKLNRTAAVSGHTYLRSSSGFWRKPLPSIGPLAVCLIQPLAILSMLGGGAVLPRRNRIHR